MRVAILISLLVIIVAGGGAAFVQQTRRAEAATRARDLTGGDVERGKTFARERGCGACHVTPGVRGPKSNVGPSLEGFGARSFLAGAADNKPETLMQFLRDPRSVAPKSAMPKVGVTEDEARDLAAYLYSLR